jgi:hypothetical protein
LPEETNPTKKVKLQTESKAMAEAFKNKQPKMMQKKIQCQMHRGILPKSEQSTYEKRPNYEKRPV